MFQKGGMGIRAPSSKQIEAETWEVKLLLPAKTWLVGWRRLPMPWSFALRFLPQWKNHPLDRGKSQVLIFRGSN